MKGSEKLKEDIINKVRELVKPILEDKGLKLVDIEFITEGKATLKVFIYNPEGTSIDDCEYVSLRLGALLDIEDLIPYSYNLEISSPGLDRKLKNKEEYEIFKGRDIKIVVKEPIDKKHVLRGELKGLEEDSILIKEKPEGKNKGERELKIPLENVATAKLDF